MNKLNIRKLQLHTLSKRFVHHVSFHNDIFSFLVQRKSGYRRCRITIMMFDCAKVPHKDIIDFEYKRALKEIRDLK